MSIEFLSFLVGSVLVGVAVIGGGFEVKELKMPRVGVAVRLLSLGFGAGFIMLALVIFGVRQYPGLAAAGTAAPVGNALVEPGSVDTAAPPVGTESRTGEMAEPDSDPLAAFAPASDAAGFGGFEGTSVLSWYVSQSPVRGVVQVNGQSGIVTITWTNENGEQVGVDEDLQLEQDANGIRYRGSNPRYSGTSTPYPEYQPDVFMIEPTQPGEWTYSRACDVNGCNAVTVQPGD